MVKTFNVDRKKGGTYEFEIDAQGNYNLKKSGFGDIKTLNLPELKAEATKTTTTQDTKTASAQTKEAFGDVQPFYYQNRGDGQRADEQYIDEYQIKKDKSLDTDINQDPNRFLPMSGPVKEPVSDKFAQSIGPQKVNIPTEKKQISRVNVNKVLNERAQKEPVSDKFKYARGPQQVNVPVDKTFRTETQKFKERYRPTEIKAAPKKQTLPQTVLKNVTTGLKPLANAIGFVMNPVMGVARIVGDKLVSPQQRQLNERNSSALSALGYKTRGELGSNIDSGRIAGNPADYVFAGMNAQSMRGDVFNGARGRVKTRSTTGIKRVEAKYGKDSKQAKDFRAKTQEFKGQIEKAQGEKNKQDIAKGPGALGPAGGGGNGGGNTRVICTELHKAGEMSTVDWIRDTRFTFKTLTQKHVKGYLFWAVPTVKLMKKYPLYRKIWKHLAQHRANDIAWRLDEGKFDLLGRIYAGIGEPLCWLIGNCVSDKNIKEFNIKNWRRV